MNLTICDVCLRPIERVLANGLATDQQDPKLGASLWMPLSQSPNHWMYCGIDLCPSCIRELSAAYIGLKEQGGRKKDPSKELKEAVQNLLKAPHNSFNDAMWREKIKELLAIT